MCSDIVKTVAYSSLKRRRIVKRTTERLLKCGMREQKEKRN